MEDDRKAWREYYCASINHAYTAARGDNAMGHIMAVSMADRAMAEEKRRFDAKEAP